MFENFYKVSKRKGNSRLLRKKEKNKRLRQLGAPGVLALFKENLEKYNSFEKAVIKTFQIEDPYSYANFLYSMFNESQAKYLIKKIQEIGGPVADKPLNKMRISETGISEVPGHSWLEIIIYDILFLAGVDYTVPSDQMTIILKDSLHIELNDGSDKFIFLPDMIIEGCLVEIFGFKGKKYEAKKTKKINILPCYYRFIYYDLGGKGAISNHNSILEWASFLQHNYECGQCDGQVVQCAAPFKKDILDTILSKYSLLNNAGAILCEKYKTLLKNKEQISMIKEQIGKEAQSDIVGLDEIRMSLLNNGIQSAYYLPDNDIIALYFQTEDRIMPYLRSIDDNSYYQKAASHNWYNGLKNKG